MVFKELYNLCVTEYKRYEEERQRNAEDEALADLYFHRIVRSPSRPLLSCMS